MAARRTSVNVHRGSIRHVDVHAAAAGGLREAAPAQLVEHLAQPAGDPRPRREVGAGLRVEVDAQLVGVVDVGAAYRPGVEGQRARGCAAHTTAASSVGQISSAVRPLGKVIVRGLDPVGSALGHPLLVERSPVDAVRVALEVRRAARRPRSACRSPSGRSSSTTARLVVPSWEVGLVGVGEAYGDPVDVQLDRRRGHASTLARPYGPVTPGTRRAWRGVETGARRNTPYGGSPSQTRGAEQ